MCSRHSTFNFQAKQAASCKSGPNIDFNTQTLHYQPPPPTPPLPYKILFAIHFIKNFRGSLHCHLKYEALKPISHTTSCHLFWWVHYFLNIDSCYFCLYKTCGSYTSHIHVRYYPSIVPCAHTGSSPALLSTMLQEHKTRIKGYV